MPTKDLDDLMNRCDHNKDGVIDIEEFILLVTHDK